MKDEKNELHFSIVRHFGVIARDQAGWTKELNLVSWNGRDAKYDIRSWAPDKKKMRRGITLSGIECESLRTLLNTRFPQSTPSAASAAAPSGN